MPPKIFLTGKLPKVFFLILAPLFLVPSSYSFEKPLPTNVIHLTSKDWNDRPYTTVAELIQNHTSLNMETNGSRGTKSVAKIRGLGDSRNTSVILDGHSINHLFDGSVDLSQIPLNMVEDIYISRGTGSILYGGKGGGAQIIINTNRPTEKGLRTELETQIARDGTKDASGRFLYRTRLMDLTYLGGTGESAGFSKNEDYDNHHHRGRVAGSFNETGTWMVDYLFQDSSIGLSHGTPTPYDQWNGKLEQIPSDPSSLQDQEFQRVGLYSETPQSDLGTISLSASHQFRESQIFPANGLAAELDSEWKSTEVRLQWNLQHFVLGADQNRYSKDSFQHPRQKLFETGFFAIKDWDWTPLFIRSSLRYDNPSNSNGIWVPKLSVQYFPGESVQISANAGQGTRAPTFTELFESSTTISNSTLKPEKNFYTDIGIEWFNANNHLRLSEFFVKTTDRIEANPVTNQWNNRGKARQIGTEVESQWNPFLNKSWLSSLELSFQGTWQKTEVEQTMGNIKTWVPAAAMPEKILRGSIKHHLFWDLSLNNELIYESEQYELSDKMGVKLPSHSIWNIHLTAHILKATAYFSVLNAGRKKFAESWGDYQESGLPSQTVLSPQPDITFWAGLTIPFSE